LKTYLFEGRYFLSEKIYKILIIDDEIMVLDALKKTLERSKQFKSDIFLVDSPSKAMDIAKNQNFDIVISDYKMPKMSGVEILTKIKEMNPDTVRILITGYSDLEIAREAINKAAVHNYIEKPWDNENIRNIVYSAIKEVEAKKEPDLSLERLLSSDNAGTLVNALISLEEVKEYSHTVLRKDEDRLPQIEELTKKLDILSKYDYLRKEEKSPVVFKCPICSSYDYRVIIKCPVCASDYLEKGDVIEHYSCGHVDMYSLFEKGINLTCPKCDENLRQIGEDYRKVGNWIHCRKCGEFFGDGNLNLVCNSCGSASSVNQTEWEFEKRIIPNKERLGQISTKLEVINGIKKMAEEKGLFFAQNMEIKDNGKEHKYDVLVFQKDPIMTKEDNPPIFFADIGIDKAGIFKEKLKEYYERNKDLSNKNLYFIAHPFLSNDSKTLSEKYKIQAIETKKLNETLNQIFGKISANSKINKKIM